MCTWQNRMAYSSRVGSLHQKHTNTSCYAWTCQSRTKRRTWGWIGSRFTSIQGELPHSSCNVLTCLLPLAQTGLCYSLQPAEGWQFHRSESPSCPADHTAQIEWWMAVRTPAKQEREKIYQRMAGLESCKLKLRLFWGINCNKWGGFLTPVKL